MLKADDLENYRSVLSHMRARLRGDVKQLEEEAFSTRSGGDHGSSNHIAEMGSDSWERDFSLRMAEKDGELLSEVTHAIEKIDAGTFGLCEMCLESGATEAKSRIPKGRLNAIPYARNCVHCERQREDEG